MLETEIKKLTAAVIALTEQMQGQDRILDDAIPEDEAPPPSEKVTTDLPEHYADKDLPPVDRAELTGWFNELTSKYGDPAMEVIKDAILARGGTQALSQVDDRVLPIIKLDVETWVKANG